MKIFLVGMPGSGKSTVGKQLATKLNIPFMDLDIEIEKREGRSIKEIFAAAGEDFFREMESQVLKQACTLSGDFIIATGGGAPCFYSGMEIINSAGKSVFLDVPIDELMARVENDKNRPLLLAGDLAELRTKLTTLRTKRLPIYQQATITVTTSSLQEVAEKLNL